MRTYNTNLIMLVGVCLMALFIGRTAMLLASLLGFAV